MSGAFPINDTVTNAFLNPGYGVIDIFALRGMSSNAMAINNRGQVLGNWTNRYDQSHGYIYYNRRHDLYRRVHRLRRPLHRH